jgi:hypothetical protein
MPTFMVRALVDGKMIGHPVEAETEEEAKAKFAEALPFLEEQAPPLRSPHQERSHERPEIPVH